MIRSKLHDFLVMMELFFLIQIERLKKLWQKD